MRHLIYSNSWSLFCFWGTENIGVWRSKWGSWRWNTMPCPYLSILPRIVWGSQRRIPCIILSGKLLGEWWDYKMLNSNQMIRCSTPTTEKICKLNQKYQHGNLRIHDQNIHDQNIQVCLHILFLDGEKFLGELIVQGNQQLVACCITFLILLKTSNNILIFVNQHRFIL